MCVITLGDADSSSGEALQVYQCIYEVFDVMSYVEEQYHTLV